MWVVYSEHGGLRGMGVVCVGVVYVSILLAAPSDISDWDSCSMERDA